MVPSTAEYDFIDFTSDPGLSDLALPQSSCLQEKEPLSKEEVELVDACASDNVLKLKQMLHIVDGKREHRLTTSSTLPSWPMLSAAITQKKPAVVDVLLNAYPQWNMCNESLLRVAFENPHLPTFKLLHIHSPGEINMEFETSNSTALVESFVGPDPSIPSYLLDNGALVNEGGYHSLGALQAAVLRNQPLDLIKKMLDLGAMVTGTALRFAIHRQDPVILKLLLDHALYDESVLACAHETKNDELIAVVEKRAKNPTRDDLMLVANRKKMGKGPSGDAKWWQFYR